MIRYAVVIPSIECIVAMQIFKRAPEPFEKKYLTSINKGKGIHETIKEIMRILKRKIAELSSYKNEPVDYDRITRILDNDDPLIISGCIDILFDMGIATAEWQNGRRVFRIKAEAFDTVKNIHGKLGRYAALG